MVTLESLAQPDFRPPKGPQCTVATLLSVADPEVVDLLTRAMSNPYAPSTMIARAMHDKGHQVSTHSIQRHRRRECRCP